MINITKKHYSEKYNPHFRPISHQQITTVEISPTGSGKTNFYKNESNTIMLMPTNTMVRQNGGLVSKEIVQKGERCEWNEVDTSKCDYMTYDKFLGHSYHEDMSDLNIIIDEAHIVLASMSDVHYDLLDRLFERKFKYKELKLISATLRPEILDIYDYREKEPMQVIQYINKNLNPHIQFSTTIPNLKDKYGLFKKTLFFINSKDKILQIKEFYEARYQGIKIVIITADSPIPNLFQWVGTHLILATSALKQGFSLNYEIDQVVIYNVYNPVGAMDIIQYMARPRYNQPEVYVIPATTHFMTKASDMFSIPDVSLLLKKVATTGNLTTQQYRTNNAIGLDEFLARAKTSKSGWNILGVTNYYEYLLTFSELYYERGVHIIHSIMDVIPGATVKVASILEGHTLILTILKLDEATITTLENSKNITELLSNIDTIISNTTNPRILEKMNKYKTAAKNVVIDFKMIAKGKSTPESYRFTDACQVSQVLDKKVRTQCKQHIKNLDKHVYDYRDSNLRYAPNLGQVILKSKLGRKLDYLRKYFGGAHDNIKLLEKMYSFKRFDEKGKEITNRSSKVVHEVEITSMFCVESSCYYKSNIFLTVGMQEAVI